MFGHKWQIMFRHLVKGWYAARMTPNGELG